MTYTFHTEPYAHQREAFERFKDQRFCALLCEQGTGKSKIAIDRACYLYERGEIDAVVVFAPNGVHRNWIVEEFPTHAPQRIVWSGLTWRSGSAGAKWFKDACERTLTFSGLAVVVVNADAAITENLKRFMRRFLAQRTCAAYVDESTVIKTPGAKRTKSIVAMGSHCPYRTIMTGTPVTNGPLDFWGQFSFLSTDILGFKRYTAFKHHFAEWEERQTGSGQRFQVVKHYKNLEELKERIAPYSFRVTKEECLDLPPKVYEKRFFTLAPEQRRMYDHLRENYVAELSQDEYVSADAVLVRYLRLQQITSNFIQADPDDPPRTIAGTNPRLKALMDLLDEMAGKAIIWARFRYDLETLYHALRKAGYEVVRYDGTVGEDDRADAIQQFQHGDARIFLGNPQAAGRGLTLHAANTVVYYSNAFDLEQRLQSEDRPHRIGQTGSVTYYDLAAEDTIDEKIIKALREKKQLADYLNSDEIRDWI